MPFNFSFTLGQLTITPFFWSLITAAIISSFSIWRGLKEDYQEEIIFRLTLAVVACSLIFSRLLFVLFNLSEFGFSLANWLFLNLRENFSLAGAFIGAFLMTFWQISRLNGNPWEVLDTLVLPFFYFFLAGGGGMFLTTGNLWNLAYLAVGLAGILGYSWLKKKYRSLTWYQSGKTGFLISFCSFLIFALLILLAFLENGRIYFDELILALLMMVCLAALYYRSERDLKKDLKSLFKGHFVK